MAKHVCTLQGIVKSLKRYANVDTYLEGRKVEAEIKRLEADNANDLASGRITQVEHDTNAAELAQHRQDLQNRVSTNARPMRENQIADLKTRLDNPKNNIGHGGLGSGMLDATKIKEMGGKTLSAADEAFIDQKVNDFNRTNDLNARKDALAELADKFQGGGKVGRTLGFFNSISRRTMLSNPGDVLSAHGGGTGGRIGDLVGTILTDIQNTITRVGEPGEVSHAINRFKHGIDYAPEFWKKAKEGRLAESSRLYEGLGSGRSRNIVTKFQDAVQSIADDFLYESHYRSYLDKELRDRGLDPTDPNTWVPEDAHRAATKKAHEGLWGEDGLGVKAVTEAQNGFTKVLEKKFDKRTSAEISSNVFMFSKMIAKISGMVADGLGWKAGTKGIRLLEEGIRGKGIDPTVAKDFKRGLVAWGIGAGAFGTLLSKGIDQGWVTPSYNPNDPDRELRNNAPDASINVGKMTGTGVDYWVPVQMLGPYASAGLMVADSHYANKAGKMKDPNFQAPNTLDQFMNIIKSNSMGQILLEGVDLKDPAQALGETIAGKIGSVAQPGFVRYLMNDWLGASAKEIRSGADVDTVIGKINPQKLVNNVLGLYSSNERTGTSGEPITKSGHITDFQQRLMDLSDQTGNKSFITKRPSTEMTINGEKVKLSSEQLAIYEKAERTLVKQLYEPVMNDSKFIELTPDQQAKVLGSVRKSIDTAMKVSMFGLNAEKDELGGAILAGNLDKAQSQALAKIREVSKSESPRAEKRKERKKLKNQTWWARQDDLGSAPWENPNTSE